MARTQQNGIHRQNSNSESEHLELTNEAAPEIMQARFELWKQAYRNCKSMLKSGDSPVLENFALSISLENAGVNNAVQRLIPALSFLKKQRWKNTEDSLQATAELIMKKGRTKTIFDKFTEVLPHLSSGKHNKHLYSASAAIELAGCPRGSVQQRVKRFTGIKKALVAYGYPLNSPVNAIIAGKLTVVPGKIRDVIATHRKIEIQLVADGRIESAQSGIAAALLMQGDNQNLDMGKRFNDFYASHQPRWNLTLDDYPAVATLVRHDADIDKLALQIERFYFSLQRYGFKENSLAQAIALVTGDARAIYSTVPKDITTNGRKSFDNTDVIQEVLDDETCLLASLQVNNRKQKEDYTCGAVCAAMALEVLTGDSPYKETDVASWLRSTSEIGTPTEHFAYLDDWFNNLEIIVEKNSNFDRIRELITNDHVVILNYRLGQTPHYSIVKAISDTSIILSDPYRGQDVRRELATLNWSGGYAPNLIERGFIALANAEA